VNGAGGLEKDAGLKIRQYKDRTKTAGLKPHTYEGGEKPPRYKCEEKKCGWRRNRAIGSIATKTWDRVAWILIIVKYYYLRSIIRMRLAEVPGKEWVGRGFVVW
jgi:hypothetical protein